MLSDVRNKLNLTTQVPTYIPLESDQVLQNPSNQLAADLTKGEKEHIQELGTTTFFVETHQDCDIKTMVEVMRAYGSVKVTVEHERGFWCTLSDISNGLTLQ